MSVVCIVPSSSVMWCATTSLFLKTTSCPGATVAGFGENAARPPWPVMLIVTVVLLPPPPPPLGAVGVEPPPPYPPPPQLAATTAAATASAALPALYMDVLLQPNRT